MPAMAVRDVSMTDEERKALVVRPSSEVGRIGVGARNVLSHVVSDALVTARSRLTSPATIRFRIGDYEFREPDYRQILLWAEALGKSPENILQGTSKNSMPLGPVRVCCPDGMILGD